MANSVNKNELIEIFKKRLIKAAASDFDNPPQDHLKLFDHMLKSDIVKQLNLTRKKHYLSS